MTTVKCSLSYKDSDWSSRAMLQSSISFTNLDELNLVIPLQFKAMSNFFIYYISCQRKVVKSGSKIFISICSVTHSVA